MCRRKALLVKTEIKLQKQKEAADAAKRAEAEIDAVVAIARQVTPP
jgi:hypothetical protein